MTEFVGPAPWGSGTGLAGKGLIVTGASSGIDRAMALEAAPAGFEFVLVDRAADVPDQTYQDVRALGARAWPYAVDLTEFSCYDHILDSASKTAGGDGACMLFQRCSRPQNRNQWNDGRYLEADMNSCCKRYSTRTAVRYA